MTGKNLFHLFISFFFSNNERGQGHVTPILDKY